MKPECFPLITPAQCPQIPYYPITVIYGKDTATLYRGAQTLDPSCVNLYDDPVPVSLDAMLRQLKHQRRVFRNIERLFFTLVDESDHGGPVGEFRITAKHATVVCGEETYALDQLPVSYQTLLRMLIRWQSAPCVVCCGPEKVSSLISPNISTVEYLQIVKEEYAKPIVLFSRSRVFVHSLIRALPAWCQFYRMG